MTIAQCTQFYGISTKTDHTVVEYFSDCKQIWCGWIWDERNTPKLGRYGEVVEMDESFFSGVLKYIRGRRLGTTWEENDKWDFGLAQSGSLEQDKKHFLFRTSGKHMGSLLNN